MVILVDRVEAYLELYIIRKRLVVIYKWYHDKILGDDTQAQQRHCQMLMNIKSGIWRVRNV